MKLRVRSTATRETIRIDIPSSSSLFDLKTLISLNLSATIPIPAESIHLSLNRTDEIASSPDEPLHALGLTSGDLLFYSLDSILNSTPEIQNLSPASPGETLAPLSSAPDPPTDDMEVESESEPLVQQKAASVPGFLRRVMEAEKEKIKGNMGLTVVAVHAVFLESGFVACGVSGGSSLPEGCASASHLVSVMYTLPDLISCDNFEDVKNIILKFSAVRNHVSIYGRLVGARPDIYRLSLDSSKLAPLLASAVNELNEKEQEDVFQLWKIVKDSLTLPLLIDICQNNGLALPPCFTGLPTDLKMMILELLPAIDLAKAACTCSELRYLTSNDELWKRRFLEEFEMFVAGSTGGFWNDKFAKFWVKRKKSRLDRGKALAPYIGTARIIPVPLIPSVQCLPIIGGDSHRARCLPIIGGDSHRAQCLPIIGGDSHRAQYLPIIGRDSHRAQCLPIIGGDSHRAQCLPIIGGDSHRTQCLPIIGGDSHRPQCLPIIGGDSHRAQCLPIIGGDSDRAQCLPIVDGDSDRLPAIGNLGSLQRAGFNQHAAGLNFSSSCNLFGGGF